MLENLFCVFSRTIQILRHNVMMARYNWLTKYKRPETWPSERPLISIVIPCYNHGQYLAEAVDSIMAQTWQELEIIIVNDGSTDDHTRQILDRFTRPKTRIIHHTENRGLPAARNTGIRNAKGKYICCLDSDDRLPPTYIEKALLTMESNYGISIVYSWVQVFGDESRVWYAPQFDPETLPYYNQIVATGVFRRDAWEVVGGFREEMRMGYEDWEYWARLARHGYRGYRIPEKMIHVRRVGRSFIHAAMERHDQLVADMHHYNPGVYDDGVWVNEIKRSYSNIYIQPAFERMKSPDDYLRWQDPKIWHIWETSDCVKKNLSNLRQQIDGHSGNAVIVAYNVLDEDVADELYSYTPYVYILPHFLARYAWKSFGSLLLHRTLSAD